MADLGPTRPRLHSVLKSSRSRLATSTPPCGTHGREPTSGEGAPSFTEPLLPGSAARPALSLRGRNSRSRLSAHLAFLSLWPGERATARCGAGFLRQDCSDLRAKGLDLVLDGRGATKDISGNIFVHFVTWRPDLVGSNANYRPYQ